MTYINIIKQNKYRIEYLKYEYKYQIYKSVLHNRNIKPIIYGFLKYKKTMWSFKKRISFQKKICLILSKYRSVNPKLMLKRHSIKKLNGACQITNLKMSKW